MTDGRNTAGYALGIDGGASQSILRIVNRQKESVYEHCGDEINPYSVGHIKSARTALAMISRAVDDMGIVLKQITAVCIGAAGIHNSRDAQIIRSELQRAHPDIDFIVTNDYETALVAGTGSAEGIIVISGTGSVAYGRSGTGGFVRAGGWGHILGDEGSAFAIGKDALIAVFKARDSMGPDTILGDFFLKHSGTCDWDGLMQWVYDSAAKRDIALLAPKVYEAAIQGDSVSREILLRAADNLVMHISNIRNRLTFSAGKLPLVISGSVLKKNHIVREQFLRGVKNTHPDISLAESENDAAYGAALIALNGGRGHA